jgi:hypothetical protein
MSTFNYDGLADLASTLIANAGFKATLRRETQVKEYPWSTPVTTAEDNAVDIILGTYKSSMIDGETIKRGDIRVYVAVDTVIPTVTDFLVIRGKQYTIIDINAPAPGGIDLLYEIQARGA